MTDIKNPAADQRRYGTFSYQLPPPVPVAVLHPPPPSQNQYQNPPPIPPPGYHPISVGYQSVPYSPPAEGIPVVEPRLPCCGIGIGWVLFLSGFFLAAIPWYVGVFILLFVATDYREKPGLVACTVAAALATVPVIFRTFSYYFYG